jgi:hypothetical protein
MSHCETCSDETRARYKQLDELKADARQRAIEEKRPMAICQEQGAGYFIADAETAVRERFWIIEVISGLQ